MALARYVGRSNSRLANCLAATASLVSAEAKTSRRLGELRPRPIEVLHEGQVTLVDDPIGVDLEQVTVDGAVIQVRHAAEFTQRSGIQNRADRRNADPQTGAATRANPVASQSLALLALRVSS
jgi:hypothetical protein